jgi:fumarate reductase subunit C
MGPPMTPYRRPVRFTWWLGHRGYTLFDLRELTSLFIGAEAVLLLLLLHNLSKGREAYEAYLTFLTAPGMIVLHIVALAAAIFHAVTWFALAPKAMVVRVGGRRVPPPAIIAANYGAWAVASLIIAWIVLGRVP